jgi:predicted ferric reductase
VPTLWIRRRFYEFVVATHSILSYVYVTILWFHIPFKQRYYLITLITASSLLVLQKLFQVSALYFRNRSFSAVNSTSIKRFDSIACLKIWPELPWKYRPGHYIYLRDPRVPKWAGLVLTRFQSHPYQIAWYSNEKGGEKVVKVYLLVQSWRGFSKWLNKATISSKINPSSPYDELELNSYKSRKETEIPGSSGNLTARQYENFPCVQIQGPYGSLQPEQYEKLVLLSNGIGIASHLAVAKYLIEVGNQNLTRRIDLVWYSQSIGKFGFLMARLANTENRAEYSREEILQKADQFGRSSC